MLQHRMTDRSNSSIDVLKLMLRLRFARSIRTFGQVAAQPVHEAFAPSRLEKIVKTFRDFLVLLEPLFNPLRDVPEKSRPLAPTVGTRAPKRSVLLERLFE